MMASKRLKDTIKPFRYMPGRLSIALLWSFAFHLLLLLLFSVSSFFLPPEPSSKGVDLQLDLASSISLTSLELVSKNRTKETLLESCFIQNDHFTDQALLACSNSLETSTAPLIQVYTPPKAPWNPGQWLIVPLSSVYPLKLSFQGGINKLSLTNDGSDLFIQTENTKLFYTPLFAETLPKAVFYVTVNPLTGCITNIREDKTFSDRRLQKLATILLKRLRFQSKEDKIEEVKGEISLQFAGSFGMISPLLRTNGDLL